MTGVYGVDVGYGANTHDLWGERGVWGEEDLWGE